MSRHTLSRPKEGEARSFRKTRPRVAVAEISMPDPMKGSFGAKLGERHESFDFISGHVHQDLKAMADKLQARAAGGVDPPHELENNGDMADPVGRSELDAKLDALRQEMRADSAALRGDFATMSATINQTIATMAVGFADLRGDFKGGMGEVRGSVEGVRGSVDGLKSSIATMQWLIGSVLAAGALYIGYIQLKQAETAPTSQQAPVIIQMPAQQAAAPAALPASKP